MLPYSVYKNKYAMYLQLQKYIQHIQYEQNNKKSIIHSALPVKYKTRYEIAQNFLPKYYINQIRTNTISIELYSCDKISPVLRHYGHIKRIVVATEGVGGNYPQCIEFCTYRCNPRDVCWQCRPLMFTMLRPAYVSYMRRPRM